MLNHSKDELMTPLSKEDKVSRIRAELSIAEQIGAKPNLTQLAKKYDLAYSQVRDIAKGKEVELEDKAVFSLVDAPKDVVLDIAQQAIAKTPDKPLAQMEEEIDFVVKGAEGLKKLRYDVQRVAQKAIDRLDLALDVQDNQEPRNLKYLIDSLAAVNSSFFKDSSTNITVNNTANHLTLFRENMSLWLHHPGYYLT